MSKRIKLILSILGILAIGFMTGFQSHRMMTKKHIHRIAKERIGPNFGERMMDLLDVTDQQRTQLNPIFEKYGPQLQEMKDLEKQNRKVVYEEMGKELRTHLNEAQIKQLDEMREKRQGKRMKSGGCR